MIQLIKKVSTEKAATRVAYDINERNNDGEYRTFLLNGPWGSGKTTFLTDVEMKAECSPNPRDKFVYLRLWEGSDSRPVSEIVFQQIFPITYWTLKVFVILTVVLAILITPSINVGLTNEAAKLLPADVFNVLLKTLPVLALAALVWQFLKFKSDSFYRWGLKRLWTFSKVLVVDDFDRVRKVLQEDAYKVFNTLSGRIPIIFVGDISKLTNSNNDLDEF
ncbi:KAP family NTPase [Weissella confusa]|uniref:P-loop NTPase fold protein n=1 Tax=Weissella confusa TaxID=1583 RepID=UPI001C6FB78B|nr:P-loop NTPase fold protein [Weissella confusa]QYU57977.1 KAP family NTPase [Weissella confusa]